MLFALALTFSMHAMADTVVVGDARYTFADRRFSPIFERTLIFGHSISSGLQNRVRLGFGPFGEGPGTVLHRDYAKQPAYVNMSEGAGTSLESGLHKMRRWLIQEDDNSSPERQLKYMNKVYRDATVLVGVDAFYLSATRDWNECDQIGHSGVDRIIDHFSRQTFEDGKVLILGNVPKEDWSKLSLFGTGAYRGFLRNVVGLSPMDESCRATINRALAEYCTPERNCYIVDLEAVVARLNSTGKLTLKSGEELFASSWTKSDDVRPDGVNLSHKGVQILVEAILTSLEKNPLRTVNQPVINEAK